jgi:hypothetical protein
MAGEVNPITSPGMVFFYDSGEIGFSIFLLTSILFFGSKARLKVKGTADPTWP